MADDKKKDDKKKDDKPKGDPFWETVETIGLVLLGVYLLYKALTGGYAFLTKYVSGNYASDSVIRRLLADPSWRNLRRLAETSDAVAFIFHLFTFLKVFSFLVSLFFLWAIFWLIRATMQIQRKTAEELAPPPIGFVSEEDPSKKRWKRILEHVESDNPSNWRLAILEADIILDEILERSGYRGETIGDKLKTVEPSDMPTLDEAWEAHKIRNAIAHQGESFTLTSREARRVISLYEKVFRDFQFI